MSKFKKILIILSIAVALLVSFFAYSVITEDSIKDTYLPSLEIDPVESDKFKLFQNFSGLKIGLTGENEILIRDSQNNDIGTFSFYVDYVTAEGSNIGHFANSVDSVIKNDSSLTFCIEYSIKQSKTNFFYSNERKRLNITINSIFKKDITLFREAVVFNSALSVNAVVKKNNKLVKELNSDEYWLGKQGKVNFSNEIGSYVISGNEVSSMQLDLDENNLWINSDYAKDHPYIRVKENGGGDWEDLSLSKIKDGDSLKTSFSILFDREIENIPRKMQNPDGYLSTFIWTEHADNTILETHKAVYYGGSRINEPENVVGGFVKHNIPVTKSVFFSNVDSSTNIAFNEENDELQASITTNPEYLNFLKDLYNTGRYEIALHTLDLWSDLELGIGQKSLSSELHNNYQSISQSKILRYGNHSAISKDYSYKLSREMPFYSISRGHTSIQPYFKENILDSSLLFMQEKFNTATGNPL